MRAPILFVFLFAASVASANTDVDTRLSLLSYSYDRDPTPRSFTTSLLVDLRLKTDMPETGLFAETLLAVTPRIQSGFGFTERSSSVQLGWRHRNWKEQEAVSLIAYPFASERLHLGYEHPATWGRRYDGGLGGVPALELRVHQELWNGFAAVRTTSLLNDFTHDSDQGFDWLAGAGGDPLSFLRFEAGVRRVDHGVVSALGTGEQRARTSAVSGRLLFHTGDPIHASPDFARYGSDPEWTNLLFEPETYTSRLSTSLSVEATYLAQRLAPNSTEGLVDVRDAVAALQARAKKGPFRAHLFALCRTGSFPDVWGSGTGWVPIYLRDTEEKPKPEIELSAGVDYHFARFGLTPGVVVSAGVPASVRTEGLVGGNNPPESFDSSRTLVTSRGSVVILPAGSEPRAHYGAKATLRWDHGSVGAFVEAGWTHDPNRSAITGNPLLLSESTPAPTELIDVNAVLQARF